MSMGALNAAPIFVSASNTMELEWNKDAAKKGLNVDKAGEPKSFSTTSLPMAPISPSY
jgi:hypothetical protein